VAGRSGSGYEAGYRRVRTLLEPFLMFMGEPAGAARAIGKALTVSSPPARYLVGRDARAIAAAQPLVPTRIRDRVTRLLIGL
jgi:hypothetical protein